MTSPDIDTQTLTPEPDQPAYIRVEAHLSGTFGQNTEPLVNDEWVRLCRLAGVIATDGQIKVGYHTSPPQEELLPLDAFERLQLNAFLAKESALAAKQAAYNLSDREKEVLSLVREGMTNAEIAANLFLSAHTVKTHLHRMGAKLQTGDRTKMVVTYFSIY